MELFRLGVKPAAAGGESWYGRSGRPGTQIETFTYYIGHRPGSLSASCDWTRFQDARDLESSLADGPDYQTIVRDWAS
jgi:hypothetical protein